MGTNKRVLNVGLDSNCLTAVPALLQGPCSIKGDTVKLDFYLDPNQATEVTIINTSHRDD